MIFFADDNLPLFTYCMCTHTLLKSLSRGGKEREREKNCNSKDYFSNECDIYIDRLHL
jgi:hypothetical protein